MKITLIFVTLTVIILTYLTTCNAMDPYPLEDYRYGRGYPTYENTTFGTSKICENAPGVPINPRCYGCHMDAPFCEIL